ncbi:MAG: hypothetical protein CL843_02610, partial [Crocinitomicaceae bacterium]|nr:hypothetical protein [Crocinitomicaceae bacterium]
MNKLTFFKLPLLVFFFFNAFCSFAQQEDWQWVNQFGSQYKDLVNNGDEEIWDMEVDDSGNVYLVGGAW